MSFLEELNTLLTGIIPVETGVFSGKAPDEYIVVTPMADTFGIHADNRPQNETQEARLSLFSKGNYVKRKNQIARALLAAQGTPVADFTITSRMYVGHEDDTGYHHYAIDVAKNYELED
jgi:hypothetical protein